MYDPQARRRHRLLIILLVLSAFALGVQAERHGWLSPWHEPADLKYTFRPFWETWYLVHDKYVDQGSVNNEHMTQGAILGMLASLGDIGHTTYLTKEEVQRLQQDLKGELYGIGASVGIRKKRPTIIYTLPNSPARAAGLKPGDVIDEHTDEQLQKSIEAAKKQGAKGIILDLRINPGGLKEQAVKATSEFLKSGEVVFLQKDAKGQTQSIVAENEGIAADIPLCLLIDEGTASSAEILAGAIQDHERGKLIGTRTFGTGTVLGEFRLTDGSAVLLAIFEWLTPKGRQIWHKGISPDIEVSLPQDATIEMPESETHLTADQLAKSDDTQLLKAIEVMKKELR